MAVTTLRPDADHSRNANAPYGGYSTDWQTLSDNNDSTGIILFGNAGSHVEVNFGTIGTPASNQRILQVRPVARLASASSGLPIDFRLYLHDGAYRTPAVDQQSGAARMLYGAYEQSTWDGLEWTKARIDSVRVKGESAGGGSTAARLYEYYVEVDIRTKPTISGVGPTGANPGTTRTPTATWTFTDPDGQQGQYGYRVKVFSEAQYLAGGFDPETSAATWDSGDTISASQNRQVGAPLADGAYRMYVKASKDFRGGHWFSDWSYSSFSISDTPAVPTSVTPASGATVTTSKPTLGATVVASALSTPARVEWQVASDAAFSTNLRTITEPVEDARVSGTTSEAWPAALARLPQGTWHIRARAIDTSGKQGGWSAGHTFTVSHPPSSSGHTPTGDTVLQFGAGTVRFDWDFTDTDPGDTQSAFQVEISRNDTSAIIHDSGKVTSATTHYDHTHVAGNKDLPLRWRVRLYDVDNVVGPWSSYHLYRVSDAPSVTVTNPSDGGTVNTPQPTVQWTRTLFGGRTATHYRVRIAKWSAPGVWIHDSGWAAGANTSYTIPAGLLQNSQTYIVRVDVRDSAGLENFDENTFTVAYTPPPAVTFSLDTDDYATDGYVTVSWNAQEDPEWVRYNVYHREVGAASWRLIKTLDTPASSYTVRDYLVLTDTPTEFIVTQVATRFGEEVEGDFSNAQTRTLYSEDYWIVDQTNNRSVRLFITTADQQTDDHEVETLNLIGRGRKVNYGTRYGYTGTLSAQLYDHETRTARQQREDLLAVRQDGGEVYLRNPFGDLLKIAITAMDFSRIAGVGKRDFATVSISYTEIT